MGAHPSKQRSSAPGAHPSTSTTASTSKPQDDQLVSYEAACRQDPEIHTIDTTIRSRMSRCISSIAVGVEVRALSLDSLREVTGTLLDMNQEVVKVILECKKDVWKDPELFDLVEDYFECSLQTLDFCTALDKCLKKARDAQLIVSLALQRFDDEDEDGGTTHAADNNNRYRRALEELRAFRAVGDPFTDDFFQQFRAVYTQQLHMLDRLQARKGKLDKKLKAAKAWRKVSSVIFISACAAVLICSVVAAAMAAPPVAAALAAAASAPLGSMGKWIDSLWAKYEDAIKAQKELVSSISVGTYVAVKDLDNIRVLVDALEINIDALLRGADFALAGGGQGNSGEDGEIDLAAVRVGVEEVRRKLSAFTKGIEELGEQADRCSRDIRRARTVVLQRIIKQPNSH